MRIQHDEIDEDSWVLDGLQMQEAFHLGVGKSFEKSIRILDALYEDICCAGLVHKNLCSRTCDRIWGRLLSLRAFRFKCRSAVGDYQGASDDILAIIQGAFSSLEGHGLEELATDWLYDGIFYFLTCPTGKFRGHRLAVSMMALADSLANSQRQSAFLTPSKELMAKLLLSCAMCDWERAKYQLSECFQECQKYEFPTLFKIERCILAKQPVQLNKEEYGDRLSCLCEAFFTGQNR